jgi:hypothetical protein
VIVRILGEGQLDVPESALEELNTHDADVAAAVDAGDEATFRAALVALLTQVRAVGTPLADESLEESDLVLPHAEATMADVVEMLGADGLVPG